MLKIFFPKWTHRRSCPKSDLKKLTLVLVFIIFIIGSIVFFIDRLDDTFQKNTSAYMDEIAAHDVQSVDSGLQRQWERMEGIVKRLELGGYQSTAEVQDFLRIQMEATGFESVMLIDQQGRGYQSNDTTDIGDRPWSDKLLRDKKYFVEHRNTKGRIELKDALLYGISFDPITIDHVTFVGLTAVYDMTAVQKTLQLSLFGTRGRTVIMDRDGYIVTSDAVQKPGIQENFFRSMDEKTTYLKGDRGDIRGMLLKGESCQTIYQQGDKEYLAAIRPLQNADWLLAEIAPLEIANSQTGRFLTTTMFFLGTIGVVIGALLLFSFFSYRNTIILKNSKEVFYREELFNLLTTHIDDVFVIYNTKTKQFDFVSENIERIFGIMREEYILDSGVLFKNSLRSKGILFQQKQREAEERLNSGCSDLTPIEMEFERLHPISGDRTWIHVSLYPVSEDLRGKTAARCIIIFSDTTKLKRNENMMKGALDEARRATRAKSEFLSNMSHEIRTPLNGMLGLLNLMKHSIHDSKKLEDYVQKANISASYLISLINDILDMSKIESGRFSIEKAELDVIEFLSNIETMYSIQAEEKAIRFEMHRNKITERRLRGDALRVQQIMMNLLSNALKFTAAGGHILMEAEQIEAGEDYIKMRFSIIDSGCGMSEAFLQRIWEPFEQERLDTARKYGGTGLGLAISRQLTFLMSGTITAKSKLGEGSSFIVEIPFETAEAETVDCGSNEKDSAPERENSLEGMKVLLAEDNELNMEIAMAILEIEKVQIVTAKNGKEAVEQFQQSGEDEFDAILMDVQMPVMSGYEAADAIRAMERRDAKKVPIIACTANVSKEDNEKARVHGMNETVAKPIDVDFLMKLLAKCLLRR